MATMIDKIWAYSEISNKIIFTFLSGAGFYARQESACMTPIISVEYSGEGYSSISRLPIS